MGKYRVTLTTCVTVEPIIEADGQQAADEMIDESLPYLAASVERAIHQDWTWPARVAEWKARRLVEIQP